MGEAIESINLLKSVGASGLAGLIFGALSVFFYCKREVDKRIARITVAHTEEINRLKDQHSSNLEQQRLLYEKQMNLLAKGLQNQIEMLEAQVEKLEKSDHESRQKLEQLFNTMAFDRRSLQP